MNDDALHWQRQLLALGQAASAVQQARTPAEVFQRVGHELTQLGYGAMVFKLDDNKENLEIIHSTYASDFLRAAEKLVGVSAIGHRIPVVPGGRYEQILNRKQAVFNQQAGETMAEALPRPARPAVNRVAALLGIEQAIFAPINVRDDVFGLLLVTGKGMSEDDLSAMKIFAHQTSIALENAQLNEELRFRADDLEIKVKQRTAALAASEGKYRALYEESPVAYFSVDADGVILQANHQAAALTGYSVEELVGSQVIHLYADSPEGKDKAQQIFQRFKTGEEIRDQQLEVCRADGSRKWISLSVQPSYGDTGALLASRSTWMDITQRVLAENEMLAHIEEVDRFNRLALGREQRVIELKQRVNELLAELGREPAYGLAYLDE